MSKSYPSILLSLLNEVGKQVGVGNFLILLKTDSVPPLSFPQASSNFPLKPTPRSVQIPLSSRTLYSHNTNQIWNSEISRFPPLEGLPKVGYTPYKTPSSQPQFTQTIRLSLYSKNKKFGSLSFKADSVLCDSRN